jgi:hypothetical protein
MHVVDVVVVGARDAVAARTAAGSAGVVNAVAVAAAAAAVRTRSHESRSRRSRSLRDLLLVHSRTTSRLCLPFSLPFSPKCLEEEFPEVRDSNLPVPIEVGPSGRGCGLLGTPKVCTLGTRVAWIRCKPLRLDTAELPENFQSFVLPWAGAIPRTFFVADSPQVVIVAEQQGKGRPLADAPGKMWEFTG